MLWWEDVYGHKVRLEHHNLLNKRRLYSNKINYRILNDNYRSTLCTLKYHSGSTLSRSFSFTKATCHRRLFRLALGVPRETWHGESRVSLTPIVTAGLVKKGFSINVESGAGAEANFKDAGSCLLVVKRLLKFWLNSMRLVKLANRLYEMVERCQAANSFSLQSRKI